MLYIMTWWVDVNEETVFHMKNQFSNISFTYPYSFVYKRNIMNIDLITFTWTFEWMNEAIYQFCLHPENRFKLSQWFTMLAKLAFHSSVSSRKKTFEFLGTFVEWRLVTLWLKLLSHDYDQLNEKIPKMDHNHQIKKVYLINSMKIIPYLVSTRLKLCSMANTILAVLHGIQHK